MSSHGSHRVGAVRSFVMKGEDLKCEIYTEGCVAEKEFTEVLQGVVGEEFCRIVENQFTPFIGQELLDLEEVVQFYKMYALACGFDVRRYTTKKRRDGTVKSKLLVCNRQGFTYGKKVKQVKEVEEYSGSQDGELVVGDKPRRKTKVRRIGCQARVRVSGVKGVLVVDRFHAGQNHELVELKIGATKTYKMCKEHVNGFENIGASLNHFKNFHRDVKCYINERDGQLFTDRLKNVADTRENFYFDYEVDVDNSLVRAVWADGTARRSYSVIGDVVSFDPTYSTNKYSMVFTPFTGIDNHRRSVTFYGALLFRENEESFTWLFRRFLDAMGGKEPHYIITDQDPGIIASVANVFKTARHRFCKWHIINKDPVKYGSNAKDFPDFLRKLNAIVWDEELEANKFDSRRAEIMAEHRAGPEREWFQEVFKIRRQWVMAHCRELNMGSVLRTTHAIDQQRHTQKKLDSDNRHSSPKILTQLPIEIYGARLYTHEFGLSARGFFETNGVEITNLKDSLRGKVTCTCMKFERCGMLYRHIISIFSINGVKSIPDCYVARRWCKDAVGRTNEKEDNKGSGKVILSNKTVASAKAVKAKRMCNNCKQMAHHDKRNCPNPYAERPPPIPDSSSDADDNDEEVEEYDDSE
ncbi:hypothetical protein RND81_05G035800 [Saponaria officinalis]|uniref:Zinc finger PMZ-type domain-containing protein n=1 Tax=Saponaria officinalis TaxID=3572 RepID=A0AAW1KTZ1_SAPOF